MRTTHKSVKARSRARIHCALSLVLALALIFCSMPAPASGTTLGQELMSGSIEAPVAEASYAEDELIIVYADEATGLDTDAIVSEEELVAAGDGTGAITVATIADGESVEELAEELSEDPAVAYVQPNYSYELLASTDDPYAVESSDDIYNQYYLYASGFTSAWDTATASGSVTVAVLDTGCDLSHEDLSANLLTSLAYDVTTSTALASSDVANNGDSNGHGTLVCGVIAAVAGNATGIAGASYNAKLLPVRVYGDDGATTADLLAAYSYLDSLIDAGTLTDLKVINISLGMYISSLSETDLALESAIATMLDEHGVITVCAGGNSSDGESASAYLYPADFAECVSVTAVDATGADASYSDYNDAKDLSAYGEAVLSTAAGGGYATQSGTSMAAPQVSAAIALVWAANPELTASEVVALLESTADEVTGGANDENGSAGVLDVDEAVVAAASYEVDETADEDAATTEDADEAASTAEETTEPEAASSGATSSSEAATTEEADATSAGYVLLEDDSSSETLPNSGDAGGTAVGIALAGMLLAAIGISIDRRRRAT